MYNDWFSIGPFTVHGYGVMIAVGILVGLYVAEQQAKKEGIPVNELDNTVYVALIVGWLSSKLTYILVNFKDFLQNPSTFLASSGWVVYGGILGGILGGYLYCKYKHLDFMHMFNLMIPGVALAQAFGRIGCFFAGCCYGIQTHSHFGIVFPEGSLAVSGVPLVPTQLISALGDFLIFLILTKIYKNKETSHLTSAWYLILYSVGRFGIEFFRGDIERGTIGFLSTSQFISIFVFAAGILLLLKNHKQTKVA